MALTTEDLSDVHRVVFETSPDAILLMDEDGQPILANAAARELPYRDAIVAAFRSDPQWMAFRVELRARGRATLEVRVGERACLVNGRTCGARTVLFLSDVTAARDAEDDVARLWGLASIGAFAGAFVHDIGNLLTPLSALGEALAREVSDRETGAATVAELRRATSSATELVRGVRAFLRGRPPEPEEVELNGVVLELRPLIERLVGDGVGVQLALNDEVGSIVIDRVRFERGLLNLVANARDAMPAGGRLIIRTYSALIDGESFVAMSVTDEGTGMSPSDRARVFEPLFTTKVAGGTGLGLWVVHRFVREAGGRLEVHSEVGEGTHITLYLPRGARSCPSSRTGSPPGVSSTRSDDHAMNAPYIGAAE